MDSLTFIGTATTLIRLGSFTLLTDPNFLHRGQRAYLGKGLWSRRLTEPSHQAEHLPPLDAVLLSHLHGDHFDRIARATLPREQPVITTPEAADRLSSWGFTTTGLTTWAATLLSHEKETLTVQALPGIHARGLMRRLLPPVMGSLVTHRVQGDIRRRLYITGDTLTGDHASDIARAHPDIDTAIIHLGGTRVLLHTVTMDGPQGVDLVRRVAPREVVPVHYDDYRVFRSPLAEFERLFHVAELPAHLHRVRRGETIELVEAGGRPV